MSTIRNLTLGALSLLTLATAVGCGTTGLNATLPAGMHAANTIVAAGVTRKLGYSIARYNRIARSLHPVHLPRQGALPASASVAQWEPAIYDQGQLGSCTAFGMAKGLREIIAKKNGENLGSTSALFMYYNERVLENSVSEDSGATLSDGMKVLAETGAAPDADQPYDINVFTTKPSAQAYADAAQHKLSAPGTQLASIDDVRTAIANGQSVPIGFVVYNSFEAIGSNGLMPLPKKGEQVLGGHCVDIIGYDDSKKLFTVRNSWGTGWGAQGHFYMPYAFYTGKVGSQANVMEAWTAK